MASPAKSNIKNFRYAFRFIFTIFFFYSFSYYR
jgi:hypothetical protein